MVLGRLKGCIALAGSCNRGAVWVPDITHRVTSVAGSQAVDHLQAQVIPELCDLPVVV